jgi:hypothetical protein
MDREKENTIITIDSNGKTFFYVGNIHNEDENFITFWDRKLGGIRLNKKCIISIKPFAGGF